jgi:hypothetical protein
MRNYDPMDFMSLDELRSLDKAEEGRDEFATESQAKAVAEKNDRDRRLGRVTAELAKPGIDRTYWKGA